MVALDLTLNDGLLRRGLVRDVIRQIQELRKSTGLELNDRIEVRLEGIDDLETADLDVIAGEVLATTMEASTDGATRHALEIDELPDAAVWLTKASS